MRGPLIILAAAGALSACTATDGREQLERQLGLAPSEYGQYSVDQLARMKRARERDLSSADLNQRDRTIQQGGLFDLTFPLPWDN